MKKNHKKFQLPILPIILILIMITFATLYMKIDYECSDLGKKIINQENELVRVNNRLTRYKQKWSNLTSPRSMQQIIQHHGLVMNRPDSTKLVRIERTYKSNTALGINLN